MHNGERPLATFARAGVNENNEVVLDLSKAKVPLLLESGMFNPDLLPDPIPSQPTQPPQHLTVWNDTTKTYWKAWLVGSGDAVQWVYEEIT